MNTEALKQRNQIQRITAETVGALTEPIQPMYLMLKPEQYNLLAEHINLTGKTIVRNTDLISELPTAQDLNDLIVKTLRPNSTEIRKIASDGMDSMKRSVEEGLSKQTERITDTIGKEMRRMTTELKARDLSPWKIKLKWVLIGAILPSMVCIWQLISSR